MKKLIMAVAVALAVPVSAMAHGHLWYDVGAHVPQYKKLVIYPISYKGSGSFLIDEDEKSSVYQMNDYLDKKMVRRLKYKTIPLGRTLKENKEIRIDEEKYSTLCGNFPSEKERGAAVAEITAADGYLVPSIRENRVETYVSPQKIVTVNMRSWTEVRNSPQGNMTLNERKWTERHVIPAKTQHLRHMDIEYVIYNDAGESVLTFENNAHVHDADEVKLFRSLSDEFRKDMKDMVKKIPKEKKEGEVVDFEQIDVPVDIKTDDCKRNFAQYALRERLKKVKNLRPANSDIDKTIAKYAIRGNLNRLTLDRIWLEPHVTTHDKLVSSEKRKWYDRKGEKHEMTISNYVTQITDVYGQWMYTGTAVGSFELVNNRTGAVVARYSGQETDDKTSDAYLHLVDKFYAQAKKALNL